jgi:hypothetical protein
MTCVGGSKKGSGREAAATPRVGRSCAVSGWTSHVGARAQDNCALRSTSVPFWHRLSERQRQQANVWTRSLMSRGTRGTNLVVLHCDDAQGTSSCSPLAAHSDSCNCDEHPIPASLVRKFQILSGSHPARCHRLSLAVRVRPFLKRELEFKHSALKMNGKQEQRLHFV